MTKTRGATSAPGTLDLSSELKAADRLVVSWVGRSVMAGGTVGKVGLKALMGSVKRLARDQPDADQLRLDELDALAQQLYKTFGNLKGPLMKLAQMASYVDLALPANAQALLSKLQDSAPPMAAEAIAQVILKELGELPQARFAQWSERAAAAASIGQVHRAVLSSGESVAVKVQYPRIADAFKTDLRNASLLKSVAAPVVSTLDIAEIVDEIRTLLLEECDYRIEAERQEEFRRLYQDDPEIYIPAVYPEHCSERVLTSEWVEGLSFGSFCQQADQDARNRAGRIIWRFAFESIFRHGQFNCDPHPGNYLFLPDGRVAFLDFGCVKRFTPELVLDWRRMIRAVLERDDESFREVVCKLGIASKPAKFDFDYHFRASRYLYRPWLHTEPFTFTSQYAADSVRILLIDNPNRLQTNMPRDFVFANRLQWGLNSVLAQLGATAVWRDMILPLLYEEGEPQPAPFPQDPEEIW